MPASGLSCWSGWIHPTSGLLRKLPFRDHSGICPAFFFLNRSIMLAILLKGTNSCYLHETPLPSPVYSDSWCGCQYQSKTTWTINGKGVWQSVCSLWNDCHSRVRVKLQRYQKFSQYGHNADRILFLQMARLWYAVLRILALSYWYLVDKRCKNKDLELVQHTGFNKLHVQFQGYT